MKSRQVEALRLSRAKSFYQRVIALAVLNSFTWRFIFISNFQHMQVELGRAGLQSRESGRSEPGCPNLMAKRLEWIDNNWDKTVIRDRSNE